MEIEENCEFEEKDFISWEDRLKLNPLFKVAKEFWLSEAGKKAIKRSFERRGEEI